MRVRSRSVRRWRHAMGLVVAAALGACARGGGGAAASAAPPGGLSEEEEIAAASDCPPTRGQIVLDLVNRNRARAGLTKPDRGRAPGGRRRRSMHATWAAGPVAPGHEGSDGSDPSERVQRQSYVYARTAENVVAGTASASIAVTTWMGSPGHRVNILTPQFRNAGVAYVDAQDTDPHTFWVMVFGRLQDGQPSRTEGEYRRRCNP